MKDRAKEALLKCGMPANINGFHYISHAMELFYNGWSECKTCGLYEKIAKDFGTSAPSVERAIRHALSFIYTKCPVDVAKKYFDLENKTNGAQLSCFYYRLCMERNSEGDK